MTRRRGAGRGAAFQAFLCANLSRSCEALMLISEFPASELITASTREDMVAPAQDAKMQRVERYEIRVLCRLERSWDPAEENLSRQNKREERRVNTRSARRLLIPITYRVLPRCFALGTSPDRNGTFHGSINVPNCWRNPRSSWETEDLVLDTNSKLLYSRTTNCYRLIT